MKSIRNPDTCALAFLAAFPFVHFWQITLGQQVWFGTDIIRLFHPFGVELSRALNEGRLPLWTPNLLAGFPLLAEGQIAALYPPNWILFRLLPAHHALSYSILLHMAWAGVGMYACGCAFGLRPTSALLAGFVFQFNGFIFANLVHPPIVVAAAWLPWLIFLQTQFLRAWHARARRAGLYFFLAALALGVQFTTGSVQIAFLNVLAFGVIGIFSVWFNNHPSTTPQVSLRAVFAKQSPTSNVHPPTSNTAIASSQTLAPPAMAGEPPLLRNLRAFVVRRPERAKEAGFAECRSRQTQLRKHRFVANYKRVHTRFCLYAYRKLYGLVAMIQRLQLPPTTYRFVSSLLLGIALPLLLAAGIAAIQIIPTAELVGYSIRSNVSENFAASYSLPPEFLAQFVAPFAQGEPSESNNEYWGYIGIAPFLFAVAAPFLKRDRRTIFFAAFVLCALFVSVGDLNPLNQFLFRLPFFSFFRVPARYLLLVVFSGAILAAIALDTLAERLESRADNRAFFVVILFAALVLTVLNLTQSKLEFWLDAWKWLSSQLALAAIALVALALTRHASRGVFTAAMLGVVVFDLVSAAPPFTLSLSWINTPAYVQSSVRSLAVFDAGRVWTDQTFFPSVPALRNSLFPNLAGVYNKPSAQIFSSLALARNENFVYNLSPAMLNVLTVRYVTIPLEPRRDGVRIAPPAQFAANVIREEVQIAPTIAQSIEISSFTESASDLPDGTVVAELVLRLRDDSVRTIPLRVGVETADWDFERKAAASAIRHNRARVAHTFPAFWRAFGQTFTGYTHLARFDFSTPIELISVSVREVVPSARFSVERISLLDVNQRAISLAALNHQSEFTLAYLSDTVAVWRNESALPRVFIAHSAQIMDDARAWSRLHDVDFGPAQEVLLGPESVAAGHLGAAPTTVSQDQASITDYQPERVQISVVTDRAGYLVLADSWYPGWQAFVDGAPIPIARADLILRAVPVSAGEHVVTFEYAPASFTLGALVSVASSLLAGVVAFWISRR